MKTKIKGQDRDQNQNQNRIRGDGSRVPEPVCKRRKMKRRSKRGAFDLCKDAKKRKGEREREGKRERERGKREREEGKRERLLSSATRGRRWKRRTDAVEMGKERIAIEGVVESAKNV